MEVNAGSTALPCPLQPLEVERGAKKSMAIVGMAGDPP